MPSRPMISAIPTSPLHQDLSLASGMAAINLILGLIRLLPSAVSACPPVVTSSLTYRECVITSVDVVAFKERPNHVRVGRRGGRRARPLQSASAAGGEGRLACRSPLLAAPDLWLWGCYSCSSWLCLLLFCCCRKCACFVFRICVLIYFFPGNLMSTAAFGGIYSSCRGRERHSGSSSGLCSSCLAGL